MGVSAISDPDCLVEPEVEDGQQGEGDEGHAHEVGDEDVVPAIGHAGPQGGGAHPGQAKRSLHQRWTSCLKA